MKWITRERPKIDRIACPWLIKRFIDPQAEFLYDLAPQCSGLHAITLGLSQNILNDHEMLKVGIIIYDALYSWAKTLQNERHDWQPSDQSISKKDAKK